MDAKAILETSKRFGYRNIPSAERVLLDASAIDKDGNANYDNLLEFAASLEFVEQHPLLFIDQKDQLVLSDAVPGKGVCLTLYTDKVEDIEKFRQLCYKNLPKDLGWFHQCNAESYQMFEFWNPQTEAMRNIAIRLSGAMDLPCLVLLSKEYRPDVTINLPPFEAFDPEGYRLHGHFHGA